MPVTYSPPNAWNCSRRWTSGYYFRGNEIVPSVLFRQAILRRQRNGEVLLAPVAGRSIFRTGLGRWILVTSLVETQLLRPGTLLFTRIFLR